MEWGSHLDAKQHTTLTQTQCALSDAARSECNTERKLNLAMQSQLMREAGQAFVQRDSVENCCDREASRSSRLAPVC